MKKITLLCGALAMMAMVSCKNEEKTTVIEDGSADTTIVEDREVDVIQQTDTIVVEKQNPDGTSVNVNSGGVSVDSKDGSKSTTVNVTKDGAGLEVKK